MARKSLEKMLDDCAAVSGGTDHARRFAAFQSYWEEMEEAYRKGWSWFQIYSALFQEGVVDYTYQTFMRYKDRRRKRELATAKRETGGRSDPKPAPVERPARPPGSAKVGLPGFKDVERDHDDKWF